MGKLEALGNAYTYREQVARSINWGHYFLFFNLLFAIVAGSAYVYAAPSTGSFIAFVYLLCSWLGHMAFLGCVVYLVVLFPLSFIGNYRYYRVFSVLIAVLLFALLLFDIKLYLNVRVHLSAMALNLIFTRLDFNTGLNYNFLFIAIPVVIAVELALAKLSTRQIYMASKGRRNFRFIILSFLGVCFIASHSLHIWADAFQYDKITVLRSAFPAHYPMTAKSFLESHGYLDSSVARRERVFKITYPLEPLNLDGRSDDCNILTVSLDGLSYSALGENTPELLSLKQKAHSFENYYLPYTNAEDNYFALAYGLPTAYEASLVDARRPPVIIDALYHNEIMSRAVESQRGESSPRNTILGLRQISLEKESSDATVVAAGVQQIENWREGERYALMLTLKELTEADSEADYAATLRRTDQLVGELLTVLEERRLLERTLVIVTSAEGSPIISDGSRYFDRRRQHVPLMILWPHADKVATSSTELASPFDIAPTLGAEVLGVITEPEMYSLGHDLRSLPRRDFIISDEGGDIVLVGERLNVVYTAEGKSFRESAGRELPEAPHLDDLISAMRDLNRFME